LFARSFDATLERYRAYLTTLANHRLPALANLNFDTGAPAAPGEYRLADEAQKHLDEKVRQQQRASR
jgi:hypothetical protein